MGHNFTYAQQQYVTNVDYESEEKRRKGERKRKKEDRKRKSMSTGHVSVKHDEGKNMQLELAKDMLEVGNVYSQERISEFPQQVQKKAQVSVLSISGSTAMNRALSKKKKDRAVARRATRRVVFPSFAEFEQSAKETGIDNGKLWEVVDKATLETREDIETLKKIAF